jgi:hypothetical protein
VDAFLHLRDAVDAMFVPSCIAIPGTHPLDAGVNVKIFNPLKDDVDAFRDESPLFRFAADGTYELMHDLDAGACAELLGPFLKYNSWLLDTSYRYYQSANIKLDGAWRRRFLGCPDTGPLAFLIKAAHALLLPQVLSASRPVQFRKLMLRAAACKTPVLTDGAGPAAKGLIRFGDADELTRTLARLQADVVARGGLEQLAWRDALCNHTTFERLETIFAALGVTPEYSESLRPAVNIVMATIRPELIPRALEMFGLQTYANAHLTIVANGVSVPADVMRMIGDTANAKLCTVPGDKTLGYCMNFGIDQAQTEWWAKWDDDDVYGPHYLEDLMLQRKYVDFDISGKAAIFNYIESEDCIYLRNFENRDCQTKHVGGGTLLVRNHNRPFAEDGRGGEDRAFLHLARERGDRIVSGDPFNFVQVRRSERNSHTWALGSHAIDLSGPRRSGLNLDNIIL